jgi:hypothetical protein
VPRQISFFLTTPQFVARTKDVTRRVGWAALAAGETLQAVRQAQGLKKGEKVEKLGLILVRDVRREPLRRLTDEPRYGRIETDREGFPEMSPAEFVAFFCRTHRVFPQRLVTRIEYERLP